MLTNLVSGPKKHHNVSHNEGGVSHVAHLFLEIIMMTRWPAYEGSGGGLARVEVDLV